MITFSIDERVKRDFNKSLDEYVRANKRSTKGLVEHTARKVVTGFSPRSASSVKIKGLRQGFYEKRATKTKIEKEFKQREASKKGTLRPPKHYVSPYAKRTLNKRFPKMGLARTKRQAINFRKNRGSAWVQATMLYKNWRPNDTPKSRKFKPSLDSKHSGKLPPTGIIIRTQGNRAEVTWFSKLEAVVKNVHYKSVRRNALRNVTRDMKTYLKRKHEKLVR